MKKYQSNRVLHKCWQLAQEDTNHIFEHYVDSNQNHKILHIVPDIGQSFLNFLDETEDVLLTESVREPEYLQVQQHLQVSRKGTILNREFLHGPI
jgi:hypothetical protein